MERLSTYLFPPPAPAPAPYLSLPSSIIIGLAILFLALVLFGRSVGRQSKAKWQAAASLWPDIPQLERSEMINRDGLRLRRFTILADKPIGACVLIHGYAQSAHFEFLKPTYPGGPHSEWDESILQQLVEAGISCYTMDLQGHGESEGARGLRGFFECFDDLVLDALQLHDEVVRETGGALPIFWLAASMGGAVAARAAQLRPGCMTGLVTLAPMLSLTKVAEQKIFLGVRNRHLIPIASFLSWLLPTLPLIAKSDSVIAQQLDIEFKADVTNYTGSVRVRVAYYFDTVCRQFLATGGDHALERVTCGALLALHARGDTMTEPNGSISLFERASCARKALVLIGGPDGLPGLVRTSVDGVEGPQVAEGAADGKTPKRGKERAGCEGGAVGAAMRELLSLRQWHALTSEPGCEKVSAAVAVWMADEARRASVSVTAGPEKPRAAGKRAVKSPRR